MARISPLLCSRARKLRQDATDAERLLWALLRNRQMAGRKFRRQHPYGRYVLDFYCDEARLAIELDGDQHAEDEHAQRDATRDAYLRGEGIRVLRIPNRLVFSQTVAVLETIWNAVVGEDEVPSP